MPREPQSAEHPGRHQQQTLNSLRDAVSRSIDSCSERLEAAIHGSEP
jgi:hypothetical protein